MLQHTVLVQDEMADKTGGLLQADFAFDGMNCHGNHRSYNHACHCLLPVDVVIYMKVNIIKTFKF